MTLLPYFDLVYASDKAEFSMDYVKLGQMPEGYWAQNSLSTSAIWQEMLYCGQAMTASMAQSAGLVCSVVWPSKILEEILPRLESLEMSDPAGNGAHLIKQALKRSLKAKVLSEMEQETSVLISQWSSTTFAKSARRYLKSSHLVFQ